MAVIKIAHAENTAWYIQSKIFLPFVCLFILAAVAVLVVQLTPACM